jgi:hypothetical protein
LYAAVYSGVFQAVSKANYGAIPNTAVYLNVDRVVDQAGPQHVSWIEHEAMNEAPPHPGLGRYLKWCGMKKKKKTSSCTLR